MSKPNIRTKIIGVDPGLMTGVGVIDVTDMDNPTKIDAYEMDQERLFQWLEPYLKEHGKDAILVVEDYIITERTAKLSQQPWSLEFKGVCRYLTWKYGVPFIIQKPSDKPIVTNEKLKAIGIWHRGGAGHANDGLRHALIFLVGINPKVAKHFVK